MTWLSHLPLFPLVIIQQNHKAWSVYRLGMKRKKEGSCSVDHHASIFLSCRQKATGNRVVAARCKDDPKLAKIVSAWQRGKDCGCSCTLEEVLGTKKGKWPWIPICGHLAWCETLAGNGDWLWILGAGVGAVLENWLDIGVGTASALHVAKGLEFSHFHIGLF